MVPGVMIRPRFGAADESQLSIRGSGLRNNFHLRGINVLIDGFPYGNADGFSDFESLELLTTKRIEVFKGANALRFGGNTMGGAINLVTKTGATPASSSPGSRAAPTASSRAISAPARSTGRSISTRASATRSWRAIATTASRCGTGPSAPSATASPAAPRCASTSASCTTRSSSRARSPASSSTQNPQQQNPATTFAKEARNYDYTRGAFTVRTPLADNQALEWATQLNYQDLDHPLSFAVIDDTTYA